MLTRRSFLGFLAFARIGAHLLPKAQELAGPVLLTTRVAGFRFHEGSALESSLRVGNPLVLVREPGNPHDPRAIAVHLRSGERLGYVPRSANGVPSRLMDQDVLIVAAIVSISPAPAPWWERLTIELRLR